MTDKQILEKLEKIAKKRFYNIVSEFSISENKATKFINELSSSTSPKKLEFVFTNFLLKNVTFNDPNDMSIANPLVREIQAVDNHIVFYDEIKDEYTSQFKKNIDLIKKSYGRNVPKDINKFMELTHDSHKIVDVFLKKEEKEHQKEHDELIKRIQKIDPDILEDEDSSIHAFKKEYEDIISVAHHVLDWYLQEDPFRAYRKTPEKVATIALSMMTKFNEQFAQNYGIIENKKLAKLGAWKSISSVRSAIIRSYAEVCSGIEDPQLFLIDPKSANHNWRNEFDKIFTETLDYDEYIPAIRLKYFSVSEEKEPKCDRCNNFCITIGATFKDKGKKTFICEDCAVFLMYENEEFGEYLIAFSKHRRMFDISHLLMEMLIDKYLVQHKLFSIDSLPEDKFQKLMKLSTNIYNTHFTKEEKILLECIKSQKEIEKMLANKIKKVKI